MGRKESALMKQLDILLYDYECFKKISEQHICEPKIDKKYVTYNLIYRYRIPVKSIYSIVSFLQHKWYIGDRNNIHLWLLSNIEKHPMNFITQEEALLPFEAVQRICEANNMHVSPQCWAYNYFINVRKSFYVNTKLLLQDARTFFGTVDFYDDVFVKYKKHWTTMQYYVDLECELETSIKQLFAKREQLTYDVDQIEDFIGCYEHTHNVIFNQEQKTAIHNCIQKSAHIVCGFPGTGKSTIFDVVKAFFYEHDDAFNVSCMAPTGLAVKNLMKKCTVKNEEICGTIHRMVYNIFNYMYVTAEDMDAMQSDAKRMLKIKKYTHLIPDLIVVDEFSMVDMVLLKSLIKACIRFDCKLIIMGDEEQLPPVGPGNALYQMTQAPVMRDRHVTFLTDIVRQDEQLLIDNIKRIKNRDYVLKDKHFDNRCMFMLNYNDFLNEHKDVMHDKLVAFITKYNITPGTAQFLSPENNKNCGCSALNVLLQNYFNPVSLQKHNTIPASMFRIDDIVVRTQNCPIDDKGIFANGDVGRIKAYDTSTASKRQQTNPNIMVQYDNGDTQELSVAELHDDFTLRYCMTIHKSQGGEYDDIVLFMGTPHEHSSWTQSNSIKLLYTAVSRAKKRCFIIAKDNLLNVTQAVDEQPVITSYFAS
jgi:exodeoxyribonuclease V alpha subunit